ncbi:MAG: transcriptional repressor [Dehalococcoidia bacterium]|nr:transcriptional repressor [Dehalococcoidia bacterium]
MGCESQIATALREQGHKLTPQRMLIASALKHSGGHLTAAQVLEAVRRDAPYVDASTVYRTLTVLKDLRLVSETDVGEGEAVFEWLAGERHHHLICRECGGTETLEHAHLDRLAAAIAEVSGFQPDIDHFAIYGTCSVCAASSKTPEEAER